MKTARVLPNHARTESMEGMIPTLCRSRYTLAKIREHRSVPPRREWLTEREIKNVVHEEMKAALEKNTESLDKIADASQGTLYAISALLGDPSIGVKGMIPEIKDKLESIDTRELAHHEANIEAGKKRDADIADLKTSIENLKLGQGRIRKFVEYCTRKILGQTVENEGEGKSKKPEPTWKLIVLALLASGTYLWKAGKAVVLWIHQHVHF